VGLQPSIAELNSFMHVKQYMRCESVNFNMLKFGFVFLLFCLIALTSFAQMEKPKNYGRYDERYIHFGFMLGFNSANFTVYPKVDAYQIYGLKSLVSKSSPGGQVGIVSTIKLGTPVVRLRFLPTLSFQERVLQYTFDQSKPTEKKEAYNEERVNSTNVDLPMMLQFRTLRYNNFAAYVLLGGQYTIDLQSQEDASQNFNDPFVKIKRNDWFGQVGGGVEFFAPYFKFGIELKYSRSFTNSLIPEGTFIAKPVDKLFNNAWWLSFIFEG
jgi:hypothetical protein